MFKFIKLFIVLFCFISNSYAVMAPDELVRKTADDVITALKSDKDLQTNKEKIYKLAEEKILPYFDFDKISRLVLGKNWRRADDNQKTQFKEEFKNLLLRTYAVTEIIQSGGQPVAVDYVLTQGGNEGWVVIDIIIEGVSLITNYRSQFSSEIKTNGMDGLIKALAQKNKESAN
jgi:phospholipid transport system substrate-binding protein